MVELRRCAKFGRNRSNLCCMRYGDFFDFSKMAAVCYLGFVMRAFGPPTKGIWWFLSSQNLVGINAVVFIICKYKYFTSWT